MAIILLFTKVPLNVRVLVTNITMNIKVSVINNVQIKLSYHIENALINVQMMNMNGTEYVTLIIVLQVHLKSKQLKNVTTR